MSQLNMKELYSTINEKTLKRMEIYDDVLKKCHLRIKYNSTLERTYCFYQIPEFIIGVPLYDINEMKTYVMNSLKNNGFELLYIDLDRCYRITDNSIKQLIINCPNLAEIGLGKCPKITEYAKQLLHNEYITILT